MRFRTLLGIFLTLSLVLLSSTTHLVASSTPKAIVGDKENDRLRNSASMLEEIMHAPDKGVPEDLLHNCAALILIPGVKKGAFIVGGEYGRGILVVRQNRQTWGAPGFLSLSGGSFGFQIGGQSTDLILVVKNRKGIEKLINNKFKLGADASVAAGPVGRTTKADTDAQLKAEILCYSRSQGVFAGISLEGAVLQIDDDANRKEYGRKLTGKEILDGDQVKRPDAAARLYQLLRRYAG